MSAFAEMLAPIWAELKSLSRRIVSVSAATVTSVGPIRVQMDGSTAPLAASPVAMVPVGPGDRVRILHYGTTHIIFGVVGLHRGTPWRQSVGAVTITGTGTDTAQANVTFPGTRFTRAPIVTFGPSNINYNVSRSGLSATGMAVHIRRMDYTPFTEAITVHWHAVQMTSASAGG